MNKVLTLQLEPGQRWQNAWWVLCCHALCGYAVGWTHASHHAECFVAASPSRHRFNGMCGRCSHYSSEIPHLGSEAVGWVCPNFQALPLEVQASFWPSTCCCGIHFETDAWRMGIPDGDWTKHCPTWEVPSQSNAFSSMVCIPWSHDAGWRKGMGGFTRFGGFGQSMVFWPLLNSGMWRFVSSTAHGRGPTSKQQGSLPRKASSSYHQVDQWEVQRVRIGRAQVQWLPWGSTWYVHETVRVWLQPC